MNGRMSGRFAAPRLAGALLGAASVASVVLGSAGAGCSGSSGTPPSAEAGADARKDGGRRPPPDARDAPLVDGADEGRDAEAGTPSLAALTVTTTGVEAGTGVSLYPAFSPAIHDYYVRCAAGTNPLTVSMTAAPGSLSVLVLPVASATLPTQTIDVVAFENEPIVAAATNGAATTEYWVRCLPHDMAPLVWRPNATAGTPSPGYYLIGDDYPPAGVTGYAIVLDGNGVPVWYARAPEDHGTYDVDSVVPGTISYIPSFRVPQTTNAFRMRGLRPPGTTLLAPSAYKPDIHELRVARSGNYLVLYVPTVYGVDLTGLRALLPDGGTEVLGPNATILECGVIEFKADGTLVSLWLAGDHFDPAKDSTYAEVLPPSPLVADGGVVVDPYHCNSIDVDPETGDLLVSSRHMDSVFYVAWPSGTVLWKMGGRKYTKDNAAFVTAASPFYRQHDARLLPGWSAACNGGTGQISMYDDETGMPTDSRAVVYDVVVGGADGGAGGCDGGADAGLPGQATVAWQVSGPSSSVAAGSFRILADGSRVVGWGYTKTAGLVFSELTSSGAHLVDFFYGNGSASYRAVKVPLDAFDLSDLRNTAGLP